jgi:phytoene dehydrogenase-like protein
VVRAPDGPAHLDLTLDPSQPLTDGNHVFLSVGGTDDARGVAPGLRVCTASTHVALDRLRAGDAASVVAEVQSRMRQVLGALAPEWEDVVTEHTASPRTFQRFVRRSEGAVGGVPRRAGLGAWAQLGPVSPEPGLWLAGDSVFPGQSTYATALGGVRVAEAIARAR